jgi:hypothetical protein
MNTITMYILVIVMATVNPAAGTPPTLLHNAPAVYLSRDNCEADKVNKGVPAVDAWKEAHEETAVIASELGCIPIKVPFTGKSA